MRLVNISFNIGGTTHQENVADFLPEDLKALIEQHADYSDLQREKIDRLASALELKDGQMRAALAIVNEADVPPERYGAKLIEIAERFKALLATSLAKPG